nr:tyrosine-type recombinase/integrase [Dyella tabacisoli]
MESSFSKDPRNCVSFSRDRGQRHLSPAAVGEIVQRRARLAGLEGDFSGHSLCSGFVTEASRQGVSLPAIMAMTEHRAVSSVMGYFQTADNPVARLLEDA